MVIVFSRFHLVTNYSVFRVPLQGGEGLASKTTVSVKRFAVVSNIGAFRFIQEMLVSVLNAHAFRRFVARCIDSLSAALQSTNRQYLLV